jgi:hypothetical protein
MCSMYMRFVFSVYMYGFIFDCDVCVFLYYMYSVCDKINTTNTTQYYRHK